MMLIGNDCVEEGRANGTLFFFVAVVLKPEAVVKTQQLDGYHVRCVNANDVQHIVCEYADKPGQTFIIKAKAMSVKIKWTAQFEEGFSFPTTLSATLKQFPLLTNNATTGHKLQGASKTSLFIIGVSHNMNWMYVALSRVRTLSGLFLSTPIKFKHPRKESSFMAMIRRFIALIPHNRDKDLD